MSTNAKVIYPKVSSDGYRYRKDGVRIQHELNSHMQEKYGLPGRTDTNGFDPYADTVGAGIYSGTVQRDEKNNVKVSN